MELWLLIGIFVNIWSCDDLDVWSLDLKFSEKLNTALIILFDWQKFPAGTLKLTSGSKTEYLPIFGHEVTLTFDLWKPKSNQFIVHTCTSTNLNEFPSCILELSCWQESYRWTTWNKKFYQLFCMFPDIQCHIKGMLYTVYTVISLSGTTVLIHNKVTWVKRR